jgi:ribosomal RNA-processing protein 1
MDFKSIARLLAASEPASRTQGFSLLVKYLKSKSLSTSELFIVWKSIHYCNLHTDLWMADKAHEQTADEIVSLNHFFKQPFEWYAAFFETMRKEWDLLDAYRIDKYMYLVRVFLRDALKSAQEHKNEWLVLLDTLFDRCKIKGMALLYHIADVYIEELGQLDLMEKLELAQPFVTLLKSAKMNQVCELVYSKVLLKLAESCDKRLAEWAFTMATSQ